jgi:Domain of unknown function (DUF3471)
MVRRGVVGKSGNQVYQSAYWKSENSLQESGSRRVIHPQNRISKGGFTLKHIVNFGAAVACLILLFGCDRDKKKVGAGPNTIGSVAAPATFKSGGIVEGMWLGTLKDVPKQGDLRVLFTVRTEADGSLSATVDSIDQGQRGIPVNEVKLKGDEVDMTLNLIKGSFSGKRTGKDSITGKWKQGGWESPLVLTKVTEAPAMVTPVPRTEIAVDPNLFNDYVGQYALSPQFSVTITREGDKLMQQATGQGKAQIFPEAPDKFFLKIVDAQYLFKRDPAGKVTSIVLYQNKAELPGKRIR